MIITTATRFIIVSGANAMRDYVSFWAGKNKDGTFKFVKDIKKAKELCPDEADLVMEMLGVGKYPSHEIHFKKVVSKQG